MELILASTSPYRKRLLEQLGLPFRWIAPQVDEAQLMTQLRQHGANWEEICQQLAIAKAIAVAAQLPDDDTIIAGDQLVLFGESDDEPPLGKPGTHAAAAAQLRMLAGHVHLLLTAVVVIHLGEVRHEVVATSMRMRPLDDAAIERYLRADQPYDCAGAYKWESRGVTLFESVITSDPSSIVGLPLITLTSMLQDFGWRIP